MGLFSKPRELLLKWFLQGVINDALEGRYGEAMKGILSFVLGNKVKIGALVAAVAGIMMQIDPEACAQCSGIASKMLWIAGALGVSGLPSDKTVKDAQGKKDTLTEAAIKK